MIVIVTGIVIIIVIVVDNDSYSDRHSDNYSYSG